VPGYLILERAGRGAMGVVYKAKQIRLKRFVALKVLSAGRDASPEQVARLRAEAQAIARLKHPNIVEVYDVAESAGQAWFAMEYVEGTSLGQRLAGATLQPRLAAELVATIARAMHVAHQQGIIHRDLKPANVLLAAGEVPKIADFGLAKQLAFEVGEAGNDP